MHDTLNYISKDPIHRRHHHGDIVFGLHYAFSENFVLPLSHDEVVHGKGSILGRMPGDRWQRFANLRAYYAFMFGHPGKKLLFMGGEFAQEREWNHDRSLDWHLLDQPASGGVQTLVRDLNQLYRDLPALHELDCDPAGFEWLVADDTDQSVFAWLRKGREPTIVLRRRGQFHAAGAARLSRPRAAAPAHGAKSSTPMPRSMAAAMSATPGVVEALDARRRLELRLVAAAARRGLSRSSRTS